MTFSDYKSVKDSHPIYG